MHQCFTLQFAHGQRSYFGTIYVHIITFIIWNGYLGVFDQDICLDVLVALVFAKRAYTLVVTVVSAVSQVLGSTLRGSKYFSI